MVYIFIYFVVYKNSASNSDCVASVIGWKASWICRK